MSHWNLLCLNLLTDEKSKMSDNKTGRIVPLYSIHCINISVSGHNRLLYWNDFLKVDAFYFFTKESGLHIICEVNFAVKS